MANTFCGCTPTCLTTSALTALETAMKAVALRQYSGTKRLKYHWSYRRKCSGMTNHSEPCSTNTDFALVRNGTVNLGLKMSSTRCLRATHGTASWSHGTVPGSVATISSTLE